MLIDVKKRKKMFVNRKGIKRQMTRKILCLKCDECGKKFEKNYEKAIKERNFHFCCKNCLNRSIAEGELREKFKKKQEIKRKERERRKSLEPKGYEKCRITCLKKYGVDCPMKTRFVKEKAKKTNLERYGVDCYLKTKKCREQLKEHSLKNFGVKYISQSDEIKRRVEKTNLEKRGVKCSFQDPKVIKKSKETKLKKYGNKYFTNREKSAETNIKKYGGPVPTCDSEIVAKVHQTKKINGSYGKSKIENKFYEWLCETYLEENIERQKMINGWAIDFYIKPLDLYIQFDGVYYHGLNRSLEEIKKFKTKTDKTIFRTRLRDLEQNKWFKKNKKRLFRITDEEFKNIHESELLWKIG